MNQVTVILTVLDMETKIPQIHCEKQKNQFILFFVVLELKTLYLSGSYTSIEETTNCHDYP